ncbi:anthranilate/aminodeoxychorismate synthase component II [Candidatus Fermentibacteria bacterium]|nr:anthranilate/aminodeoxychorismate synthase component II [Candidatus Fermentibacteria bacterium]
MILVLDNYDSFTYNIVQVIGELGWPVEVYRSDCLTVTEVESLRPDAVVISPGPGRPRSAGISCELISKLGGRMPMLGVCLGHQCIAEVLGARVVRAETPVHGKTDRIYHDTKTIFTGVRNPFVAARYHSLLVEESSVPDKLEVSAFTEKGEIMGLRCSELMMEGVQFHPESIATPLGRKLLEGFMTCYLADRSPTRRVGSNRVMAGGG